VTPRTPNFFVVGAAKSGTTAICEYLARHPDIYIPPEKELNFFGTDMALRTPRQTWEEYLNLYFSAAGDAARLGDGSIWYLYTRRAAEQIKERVPEARIVIMLRQPVSMLYSIHAQLVYNGNETVESFEQALALEHERRQGRSLPDSVTFPEQLYYRAIADYAPQVQRYFDVFSRDRVRVILFDDFREDTAKSYRQTLEFLGVDASFTTSFEVINAAKKVRFRPLQNFLLRPPAPVRWVTRHLVPGFHDRNALRRRLLAANASKLERPPLDPETRQRLLAELLPSIEQLEQLLGRSLSGWKQ